jgi:DNA-binding MarR family transcriptional regulator
MTPSQPRSPASTDEILQDLVKLLPRRVVLLARLLSRASGSGATPSNVIFLLSYLEEGPRRIGELVEIEGLAQPTITLLVGEAEGNGWVRRVPDPRDGRVVNVHITDEGRGVLEEARDNVRSALSGALATMSDAELDRLREASETLASLLDALQKR